MLSPSNHGVERDAAGLWSWACWKVALCGSAPAGRVGCPQNPAGLNFDRASGGDSQSTEYWYIVPFFSCRVAMRPGGGVAVGGSRWQFASSCCARRECWPGPCGIGAGVDGIGRELAGRACSQRPPLLGRPLTRLWGITDSQLGGHPTMAQRNSNRSAGIVTGPLEASLEHDQQSNN